jgi:protease I
MPPVADLTVAVLARHRYQELELWFPLLRYREVGATTSLIGRAAVEHLGGVGYPAIPDQIAGESPVPGVLIVPGRGPAAAGSPAADEADAAEELTAAERDLLHAVRGAGGVVAAIGDGVDLLGAAGLLDGATVAAGEATAGRLAGFGARRADGTVHTDQAIVTAASADDLPEFVTAIDAAALPST